MIDDNYPVTTTSEFSLKSTPTRFQSIEASYYNVTDSHGYPIAGLLVLLDRRKRAVRAELHLYEEAPSHVHETAIRQSRQLIQNHYSGSVSIPLRILQTHQKRDTINIQLQLNDQRHYEPAEQSNIGGWVRDTWRNTVPSNLSGNMSSNLSKSSWPLLIGGAIALFVLIMFLSWAIPRLFGTENGAEIVQSAETTPTTPTNPLSALETVTEGSETGNSASPALVIGLQTNGLSASRNAPIDLSIGMRTRVRPGLRLTLRSEPGSEAGSGIDYLQDGQEATIVGGPVWQPGDSDTIVWWQVQLGDGRVAWAPANTSTLQLLELAQ